jgi:hypothetical protein
MKVRTTISLDGDLLKKAQQKMINVSQLAEEVIRRKVEAGIKDVPSEALTLKCMLCGKSIDYGFLCEQRDLFLCQECQDDYPMEKCKHDKRGEHEHLRIPGFEGQHAEMLKKIKN